uniref:DOMON domain-containing protein n=1 Tax=Romanomermis culicivorax TaxID=13658 RepID=A0A915J0M2_ROMCU
RYSEENFFSAEHWEAWALLCNSSYRYPEDCTLQDCEYQVRWSVQKDASEVAFHIIAHSTSGNMWTGIGFNTKAVMDGADLILGGYMDNGTFIIRDMTSNQY